MNDSGVFGGSKLGLAFFHASTKVASPAGVAGTSVEKRRREAPDRRAVVARRSIARLGSDRSVSLGRRVLVGDARKRVRNEVTLCVLRYRERNSFWFQWALTRPNIILPSEFFSVRIIFFSTSIHRDEIIKLALLILLRHYIWV